MYVPTTLGRIEEPLLSHVWHIVGYWDLLPKWTRVQCPDISYNLLSLQF